MELIAVIKALLEVGVLALCSAVVIWQVINDKKRQLERDSNYSSFTQEIINQLRDQNDLMLQQIIKRWIWGIQSQKKKIMIRLELKKSWNYIYLKY